MLRRWEHLLPHIAIFIHTQTHLLDYVHFRRLVKSILWNLKAYKVRARAGRVCKLIVSDDSNSLHTTQSVAILGRLPQVNLRDQYINTGMLHPPPSPTLTHQQLFTHASTIIPTSVSGMTKLTCMGGIHTQRHWTVV